MTRDAGALAARMGTAAVLMALLLAGLFFLPRAGVAALMALVIAVGGFEWARLCGLPATYARVYAGCIIAALAFLVAFDFNLPVFVLASVFWIVAVPAWLRLGVNPGQRGALAASGFLVLLPPALAMIALSPVEALIVLAVPWIADTAAYFAGRRWGRRKLAPMISPGKTWIGAVGGLIAAAAYAMILLILLSEVQAIRMAGFLGATALLVIVGILGDLFESAAKRQAGVKDSGYILPGHGGMLDRIDSATAVLPVAAAIMPLLKTSP